MTRVTSLPDNVEFDVAADETLLAAALRSNVAFAHACGGRAKCSTCRVWVLDGLESCPERTELEASMSARLGLTPEVRLACQLRPRGRLRIRRLVIDETDLMMCSQLDRAVAERSGEAKKVTIFFSDVTGFTSLAERLSAYDVMYILNRYFVQAGDIIERNGGFIDKFVGDGLMAIFGVDGQPDAPLSAVQAALQTLAAVDRMKPFFASMYDADFDIRIGLHYGEAVLGSLGSIGHERLTAIGDVVNVASRVEIANKDAGTRLLISEALHEEVKDSVEVADFVRVRLRGTSERMTLYEIGGLKPEAEARLNRKEKRETALFAGKKWVRAFAEDDLEVDEYRILEFDDFDVVVVLAGDGFFAFNNACPHLHLSLFERRDVAEGSLGCFPGTDTPRPLRSTFVKDRGLVCRWHNSCFDLQTGEVREWATRLAEDGTSPGSEFLGDISKNRMNLKVYACRVEDGDVWIALE
jgi:class 3 adenylate cyclase/nitrite reductase/ring-hydroxylating ferredoxin subunit